jgi:hypothetical protein
MIQVNFTTFERDPDTKSGSRCLPRSYSPMATT